MCLPSITSGQNHLAGHSERGKEIRQTVKRGAKTTQRSGAGLEFAKSQRAVENRTQKNGGTGCEVICGAPTTPAVKGGIGEGESKHM